MFDWERVSESISTWNGQNRKENFGEENVRTQILQHFVKPLKESNDALTEKENMTSSQKKRLISFACFICSKKIFCLEKINRIINELIKS